MVPLGGESLNEPSEGGSQAAGRSPTGELRA